MFIYERISDPIRLGKVDGFNIIAVALCSYHTPESKNIKYESGE